MITSARAQDLTRTKSEKGNFKSGMMNLASNSYDMMKPLKPKVFMDKAANEVEYEIRVIPRPTYMIVTSRVYSFIDSDNNPNPMLIPYEDFANHSEPA